MSGTGYDYSVVQFSPEGRVYQIEYAEKAADNGDTSVGIRCVDGVILALEKTISAKLLKPGANPHILPISPHAAMVFSGIQPDGRALANEGKDIVVEYQRQYGTAIANQTLANRIAGKVHNTTIYGRERPYGVSSLLACWNAQDGYHLYTILPNASCYRYFGYACGRHQQSVKTELEKVDFTTITVQDALDLIALILYKAHDDVKDKPFDYEVVWITEHTNNRVKTVPQDLIDAAVKKAKDAKERALMDEGEDMN